jgi:hypothetical protein
MDPRYNADGLSGSSFELKEKALEAKRRTKESSEKSTTKAPQTDETLGPWEVNVKGSFEAEGLVVTATGANLKSKSLWGSTPGRAKVLIQAFVPHGKELTNGQELWKKKCGYPKHFPEFRLLWNAEPRQCKVRVLAAFETDKIELMKMPMLGHIEHLQQGEPIKRFKMIIANFNPENPNQSIVKRKYKAGINIHGVITDGAGGSAYDPQAPASSPMMTSLEAVFGIRTKINFAAWLSLSTGHRKKKDTGQIYKPECTPGVWSDSNFGCRDYKMATSIGGDIKKEVPNVVDIKFVAPELSFWRTDGYTYTETAVRGYIKIGKGQYGPRMMFDRGKTKMGLEQDAVNLRTNICYAQKCQRVTSIASI